jgi:cytochrome c biogenesis protein CcdA
MIDAPLAIAFGSGMLATVNPCGFAMLPAYLAYFLTAESSGGDKTSRATITRSLTVGLAVSAGFLAVFSAVGLAVIHLSARVNEWTPWATIVIGVVLAVLGVAMLRGYEPTITLPKLNRGGRDRTFSSMFVFGMSYAVASISCSLPLFTSTVVGTFRREDLLSSFAAFVAYSLGMTLVLLALTVSMGMARQTLLHSLRRAMRYVTRASGLLLVAVGAYLAHYGWYERRVQDGSTEGSRVVELVTGWSEDVSNWVNDLGYTRVGLLLALALVVVLSATFGLRGARQSSR